VNNNKNLDRSGRNIAKSCKRFRNTKTWTRLSVMSHQHFLSSCTSCQQFQSLSFRHESIHINLFFCVRIVYVSTQRNTQSKITNPFLSKATMGHWTIKSQYVTGQILSRSTDPWRRFLSTSESDRKVSRCRIRARSSQQQKKLKIGERISNPWSFEHAVNEGGFDFCTLSFPSSIWRSYRITFPTEDGNIQFPKCNILFGISDGGQSSVPERYHRQTTLQPTHGIIAQGTPRT
jgi:hypothetical protein